MIAQIWWWWFWKGDDEHFEIWQDGEINQCGDTVALLHLTIDGKHYSANHQIPHSSRNPHKGWQSLHGSGKKWAAIQNVRIFLNHVSLMAIVPNIQYTNTFTVGTGITIKTIKWEKNRAGSVNHELLIGLHRKLILNHHNDQVRILLSTWSWRASWETPVVQYHLEHLKMCIVHLWAPFAENFIPPLLFSFPNSFALCDHNVESDAIYTLSCLGGQLVKSLKVL